MNIDVSRTRKVSINNAHYATAKVGKDTIENVEYFTFDHSNWFAKKEIKTFKDILEKIWDVITTPYYIVKRKTRDVYWEIRYGFQRMFKGYDAVDTFETFYKFTKRYSEILKDYRKHHIGYCGEMTAEEWDAIIDEMIYHLHYMDEKTVTEELEKDVPDDWSVNTIDVYTVMDMHKDAFFELFSKYFYHLWD